VNIKLTKNQIVAALRSLGEECKRRGIAGEICIYGGASMVLVFDARPSTRDVDAVFRPKSEIADAALIVATSLSLPIDWLNDGVKGFLSHQEELTEEPLSALEGIPNLRILRPSPSYLLAMKCLAARSDDLSEDRSDLEFLIRSLGLSTKEEVFGVVGRFYPLDRLHVRSRYFIEEVLEEMAINSQPNEGFPQ
jgi:hypothetical protein